MIKDIKYLKLVDRSVANTVEQEFKCLNSLLHFLAFNENNVTYHRLQVSNNQYFYEPYMVLFYPSGYFYYRIYTNNLNKDTLFGEKIIDGYEIEEEMETLVKSYKRNYIIDKIL